MSPAYCFGCAFRLGQVGTTPTHPDAVLQPLGACWECGVFGCSQHAERDHGDYKWVCVSTVVKAVSVAAGLDDQEEAEPTLRIESRDELEERFPRIAAATEEERRKWQQREEELVDAAGDLQREDRIDYGLLADAVGIASFLLSGPAGETEFFRRAEEDEDTRHVVFTVLPERLGILTMRLPYA